MIDGESDRQITTVTPASSFAEHAASIVRSSIFEIGSGGGEIDYKKNHSPACANGDDGHVAIRSVVNATGALRSCRSIARAAL